MKIVLLIIAVIYLINAIRVKNMYVNTAQGFDTNTFVKSLGHFLGTFFSCCTEGVCWWYIIKTVLEYI